MLQYQSNQLKEILTCWRSSAEDIRCTSCWYCETGCFPDFLQHISSHPRYHPLCRSASPSTHQLFSSPPSCSGLGTHRSSHHDCLFSITFLRAFASTQHREATAACMRRRFS